MDFKQIITLYLDGWSNRKIASQLGISRNTVNDYMQLFKTSKWALEELVKLDTGRLKELFPSRTTIDNDRYDALMQYFEKVNLARNHPGFTFQHHYLEYQGQSKDPYSYTQFMEHYNRKHAQAKGSMKLEHIAGNEVFIDYTGKKLHIVDRATGEMIPVEVFVAILPFCQFTYVEACMSQKRIDLLSCMGSSLAFFGGVPKAIVSDNLKSAVSRASKYEPEVNRSFKEFAHHHNCVVNPTRSYSPQDKALVENAVHLVYQRIFYPMREMVFFSLDDLNREIRAWLAKYNDLLFQRKGASRLELFQSVERQYLKPLPSEPYQLKDYRRAKVQKMGYVYFSPDKNYYSVPYRYIGKQTQVHYTKSMVEVYFNNDRIASHQRSASKGAYITNKEHLSSTHQDYMNWSPEYFKSLARPHGEFVLSFVSGLLHHQDYPEVNYKRAMGVIQLHRTYGSERLNAACQRASYGETYSYRMVRNILKNNLDKQLVDFQELDNTKPHIALHENIRGASNYQ